MLTTLLLSTALAQDAWEVKAPFAANAKSKWSLSITANVGGSDHEAKLKLIHELNKFESGKPFDSKVIWSDLEVDGQAMDEESAFECTFDSRGAITATKSEMGDDIRRMLSPLLFVYPTAPIKSGDKWTFEHKPTSDSDKGKIVWSYEVKGSEKIGDSETLKISSNLKETAANDSMTADGTWWVAKDGRVLKFDLKIKNWVVPMAGGGAVDATMKGEIAM